MTSPGKKKGCPQAALLVKRIQLAVVDVHRDFKAKAHFGEFRLVPHELSPSV
jgi:hypothetical protein